MRPHLFLLLLVGLWPLAAVAQENPFVDLGRVAIPQDLEWGMKILPRGEYQATLVTGRRAGVILATPQPDQEGLTYSWSLDAEVTETKDNYPQPKVEVSVVTEAADSFVQISVLLGNKQYKTLWKCAGPAIDPSQRPKELGPIDPAIETELKLLKEAHVLLDTFAEKIWPGWVGYRDLDFTLSFPNRVVVAVTQNQRLPQRFKVLPGQTMDGKTVYIDRTKELPGRIRADMSIHGHGDISGVTSILMSPLEGAGTKPDSKAAPKEGLSKSLEESMRLTRLFIYIHEAYHSLQAKLMLEAQKAGLVKPRSEIRTDFDATLDYSVYADIEGQALLKAYQEKDNRRARGYFEDAWVAREIKHKAMPHQAVVGDETTTKAEGTATYANLKMAALIKEGGPQSEQAGGDPTLRGAFKHLDEYIKKEGVRALEEMAGRTLEVTQRPYVYGAFQCFLLDRFLPQWKTGFFEKDQTLDGVIAEFLNLSAEDKLRITVRLKTDFDFNKVWAVHSRDIKERDDIVQLIMNRKGKKYMIDLQQAQRGFDIKPRKLERVILYAGNELFPHGLVKFVYGSLVLTSRDTPMRLSFSPQYLAWVDTEAKEGEKGYELKYGEKVDDLYKNVRLITKGFTMTAKTVKVIEEADTVKISVID